MKVFRSLIGKGLAFALFSCSVVAQPVEGVANEKSRRFTIAYVNDIHAQLEPHAELFWSGETEEYVENVGGLSRISTAVKMLRAERPGQVVFIDGGDTIQGSGPAAWSLGEVVVKPMNSLGLDLAIPGNWAVTYGAEALKQRASEFSYPLIAANIFVDGTKQPLFPSHLVREINGVKVGFIGLTDPDVPRRQPPFMSDGLNFTGADSIQPLVNSLRASGEVELVVLVTHIGLNKAIWLADNLEGVEVILSADTHERTYQPIQRGQTWVVEAGAFGSFLGVLDIDVDKNGKITERTWELRELRPTLYAEDPEVRAVVEQALSPYRARAGKVLGQSSRWLGRYDVLNSSIDRIIADAVREAAGTDIALTNGYRFAPPLAPGPITEGDLWNWLPMSLPLKVGNAKGSQLITYWERELENVFSPDPSKRFGGWLPRPSNMTVLFDSSKSAGHRLEALDVGGRRVEPEQLYSIASGSHRGAPTNQVHRVVQCTETRELSLDLHHAVRSYLTRHDPIVFTDSQPAVRCKVSPAVLRSQFQSNEESSDDAQL